MKIKKLIQMSVLVMGLVFSGFSIAQDLTSDSDITAGVKNKISAESSLSDASINVSTSNGVVALSGKVDSKNQATTATQLAQSTPGVKDVDSSNLNVKESDKPLKDDIITAKIKGLYIQQKLFGDKDVAAMGIKVETNDGVVTLSGSADNQVQADNAVSIAKSVAGVKEVKSNIKVS